MKALHKIPVKKTLLLFFLPIALSLFFALLYLKITPKYYQSVFVISLNESSVESSDRAKISAEIVKAFSRQEIAQTFSEEFINGLQERDRIAVDSPSIIQCFKDSLSNKNVTIEELKEKFAGYIKTQMTFLVGNPRSIPFNGFSFVVTVSEGGGLEVKYKVKCQASVEIVSNVVVPAFNKAFHLYTEREIESTIKARENNLKAVDELLLSLENVSKTTISNSVTINSGYALRLSEVELAIKRQYAEGFSELPTQAVVFPNTDNFLSLKANRSIDALSRGYAAKRIPESFYNVTLKELIEIKTALSIEESRIRSVKISLETTLSNLQNTLNEKIKSINHGSNFLSPIEPGTYDLQQVIVDKQAKNNNLILTLSLLCGVAVGIVLSTSFNFYHFWFK